MDIQNGRSLEARISAWCSSNTAESNALWHLFLEASEALGVEEASESFKRSLSERRAGAAAPGRSKSVANLASLLRRSRRNGVPARNKTGEPKSVRELEEDS